MILKNDIRYPIYAQNRGLFESIVTKTGFSIAYCNVCGSIRLIKIAGDNLRETCVCFGCGSSNRQRQMAKVICAVFSRLKNKKIGSLRELSGNGEIHIYNTESNGAIHNTLRGVKGYYCSEYFGPGHRSGETVSGTVHQDLTDLSIGGGAFEMVISSDVLEHVPDPYKAHREIHRVLRPGGRHVFTVPFYQSEFLDEERAILDADGKEVFLKEPLYHGDPIRPEGVLVFRIFSLQMLVELKKIGFRTNFYTFRKPLLGILGNAVVFEAIKD